MRAFKTTTLILSLMLATTAFAQTGNIVETADRVNRNFAMSKGANVEIENDIGAIEVIGDGGTQAVVEIEKRYGGASDAMQNRLKEVKIHLDASANSLRIKVEWPNCWTDCWGNWSWTAERAGVFIRVRVPREVHVSTNQDRGKTMVSMISGNVKIRSDRSPVEVEDVKGSLRVDIDRGRVKVRELALAGPLEIDSDRGPVDVSVTQLDGDVRVKADRGNVRLAVPSDASMDLYVDGSRRSSFRTEFPLQITGRIGGEDTHGTINGGSHKVRVEADRGKVELVKARTGA